MQCDDIESGLFHYFKWLLASSYLEIPQALGGGQTPEEEDDGKFLSASVTRAHFGPFYFSLHFVQLSATNKLCSLRMHEKIGTFLSLIDQSDSERLSTRSSELN